MTTKSEIEKAFDEWLAKDQRGASMSIFEQLSSRDGWIAGARKLLELADEHGRTTWDKEGIFREIEIDDLRKLVEGDKPQTTGDEPV